MKTKTPVPAQPPLTIEQIDAGLYRNALRIGKAQMLQSKAELQQLGLRRKRN